MGLFVWARRALNIPKTAVSGPAGQWSVSNDGGDSWSRPRQHQDLLTPGCKGSLIGYKGAVYFSGPSSVTRLVL